MTATITSKGQITIPLSIRRKLHLNPGDQIEFDEDAAVLIARRVVNRDHWNRTVAKWQKSAEKSLKEHPWSGKSSVAIVDDLRGGPVAASPKTRGRK